MSRQHPKNLPQTHSARSPDRVFTIRQEANAITCAAFRNGMLEDLHAGMSSPLVTDPTLSRITDDEMKALMIEASALVARLLAMKETNPDKYWQNIWFFHESYTHRWDQTEITADTPTEHLRSKLER